MISMFSFKVEISFCSASFAPLVTGNEANAGAVKSAMHAVRASNPFFMVVLIYDSTKLNEKNDNL